MVIQRPPFTFSVREVDAEGHLIVEDLRTGEKSRICTLTEFGIDNLTRGERTALGFD
jgi:hypothetical protein